MNPFLQSIYEMEIPAGRAALAWIGQAGFLVKTRDKLVAVDPYLSDCCLREVGFKRLMPYLFSTEEANFDLLVLTHSHLDHMDMDALPVLAKNAAMQVVCATDVLPECEKQGLISRTSALKVGESYTAGSIKITAVRCDHGDLAPDAVGLLMEADGVKLYFMGDTAFRPEWYNDEALQGVDVLILPINGAYGNLNEQEAAKVCHMLQPKLAVPCHFWNFAEHGGDPYRFMQQMQELAPAVPYNVMRMGEVILL